MGACTRGELRGTHRPYAPPVRTPVRSTTAPKKCKPILQRDRGSRRHQGRMSPSHSYWQPLAAVEITDADPLEVAFADPREDAEE